MFVRPLTISRIMGNNPPAVFNRTDRFSSLQHTGEHRRARGFFTFVSRHSCAFSMAGRGGEPSGCRFQYAGLLTLPCASRLRLAAGRWLKKHTGATPMRTLSRPRVYPPALPSLLKASSVSIKNASKTLHGIYARALSPILSKAINFLKWIDELRAYSGALKRFHPVGKLKICNQIPMRNAA